MTLRNTLVALFFLLSGTVTANETVEDIGQSVKVVGKVQENYDLSNVEFKDDFEQNRLKMHEQTHLYMPSIEYQTEKSGNQYIALTSKQGQLEHFNRGQLDKYIKDRVELGPNDLGSELSDNLIWYAFRVRLPDGVKTINAQHITFSQFKQIQKNSKNTDCHPGMYWRMNHEDVATWYAVTDGKNVKYNKTYKSNQISNNWSEFKIGTYLTEENSGWLRAYRNDELIYSYNGRTIVNQFDDCEPIKPTQTYIRIGVYRGSPVGWKNNEPDTLHFDDFVIATNEKTVNDFLSSTATNPDGSSKRIKEKLDSKSETKARIVIAKKNIQRNVEFRECLLSSGVDKTAINTMRFRPASREAEEMFKVVAGSECIMSINQ